MHEEVKRKTIPVGIFPNRASVIRLLGLVLLVQHKDKMIGDSYMSIESLRSLEDQPELEKIKLMEPECVILHTIL